MADIFIGRQPIFDHSMNVYAYELLFRSDRQSNHAQIFDGDSATSQVLMNCFVDIGLEKIVGSKMAFINLTKTFLSNPELIMIAPANQLVLEVLEDVEPTDDIIDALSLLKKNGFTIALDDFIYDSKFDPFINVSDIIKIDITVLDKDEIKKHVEKLKSFNLKLLAEKVETYEEFEFLKELDFDYYQGYFFSKPKLITAKSISPNQIAILNLIARVNDPDVEVEELSQIISTDVSLSHKVLKFINSPASGLRTQVDSIQQAVILIGLSMIKNWVTIMALATGANKPAELSTTALVRARCCELLAKSLKLEKPDGFFTVGLFSSLDAMMDQPLKAVLDDLPLTESTRSALLEQKGILGEALNCTLTMERNDFGLVNFGELGLTELSDIYLQAIHWADRVSENF